MKILIAGCESGDWECVYVNGREAEQGHTVPLDHLLRSEWFIAQLRAELSEGKHTFEYAEGKVYTDEQMDDMGNHFPELEQDLP